MKPQTSKNFRRPMLIVRNESALPKPFYYQSSPKPPISFIIHGRSMNPSKLKTFHSPTNRDIKLKKSLQSIKQKLRSIKTEQADFKKFTIEQFQTLKSNLQSIKSTQEKDINSINSYFIQQNKSFTQEISKLKLQIEVANYQMQLLQ